MVQHNFHDQLKFSLVFLQYYYTFIIKNHLTTDYYFFNTNQYICNNAILNSKFYFHYYSILLFENLRHLTLMFHLVPSKENMVPLCFLNIFDVYTYLSQINNFTMLRCSYPQSLNSFQDLSVPHLIRSFF